MSYELIKEDIAKTNVGRAMEALELAGVESFALKKKIKQLIYHTFEDTFKRTTT